MAQGGVGTIIGLAVAGVGGYWLYKTFFTAAPTAPAGGVTPATPPTGVLTTAQQLEKAAQGNAYLINDTMDPYQWEYLLEHNLGRAPTDASKFTSAFFGTNPVPSDPSLFPKLTSTQFASDLGLSGVGLGMGYQRKPRHHWGAVVTLPHPRYVPRGIGLVRRRTS